PHIISIARVSAEGAEGSNPPALPRLAFVLHCRLHKSCGCRAGRPGFICHRQRRAAGHPLPKSSSESKDSGLFCFIFSCLAERMAF
ncbi:MAG: hypothetical protein IKC02_01370, partial [Oscillospiraceae bacterium]|nr:hypothetical protein [Oscillospiraceae bacterium]